MLKQFEVTGFKNFSHKYMLDFSDVRDYKFNEHCVKNGLLKTGIVYGKNSTGKTNLGLAIYDIVAHLTDNNVSPGLYGSYINAANSEGKAHFSYVFQFGSDIVEYCYEKASNKKLISEMLILNGKEMMAINFTSGRVSRGQFDALLELVPTLNLDYFKDGSLLKYVLTNSKLGDEHPLHKMLLFVSRMLWFRSFGDRENRYIGYKAAADDYYDFILEEASILTEFQDLLVVAGIEDKVTVKADADGKKKLYSIPSNAPSSLIPFFGTASSGTRALYNFFYWNKTAPDTSFMFIDEFDAYYHFELAETIVKLLSNLPNTQVFLTSHNTNLLTNRIMRPDCFFILTSEKMTSFANATPRELREGHNLEKLYMGGEFNE